MQYPNATYARRFGPVAARDSYALLVARLWTRLTPDDAYEAATKNHPRALVH